MSRDKESIRGIIETEDEIRGRRLGRELIEKYDDEKDDEKDLEDNLQSKLDSEENGEKLGIFETLYGTISAPNKTFGRLAKSPKVLTSLFTVIIIYIFAWFLSLTALRNTIGLENIIINELGMAVPGQTMSGLFLVLGFLGVIFILLSWFIIAGSLSLWASLLGGWGNAKGLFVCYGLAMIPIIFSEVLQTIVRVTGLPGVINIFIAALAFIWILCLHTIAVRATQGLPIFWSLFVALTPIFALGLFSIFAVLFAMVAFHTLFQYFAM